mgnify:CR=1 FL=1
MSYFKKNFLNIVIIILACITILIVNNKAENILDIDSSAIKTRPDNTFNQVKYIAMDDKGMPLYTVTSPNMKQYFENEVIESVKPKILRVVDIKGSIIAETGISKIFKSPLL